MKKLFILLFVITVSGSRAQVTLKEIDFDNFIEVSEMYARSFRYIDTFYYSRLEQLRTPTLNNLISTVIAISHHDTSLLNPRFLKKPGKKDLFLWYVMREIHNNKELESNLQKPTIEVAKKWMAAKLDPKWLVDNYYKQLGYGIAFLFNTTDLSGYNFIFDSLDIKSKLDKAMFYYNVVNACGQRLLALNSMKKYDKILEYINRMPQFNGKPYYYYTFLNYDDFQYVGYQESESYNNRRIGELYNILMCHYIIVRDYKKDKSWEDVYYNSLLNMPEYFVYANNPAKLNELYKKQGKKISKKPAQQKPEKENNN